MDGGLSAEDVATSPRFLRPAQVLPTENDLRLPRVGVWGRPKISERSFTARYSLYRTQCTISETERPLGEAGPTSVKILLQISASAAGAARIKLSGTGIKG
jgi:hypothetical protein